MKRNVLSAMASLLFLLAFYSSALAQNCNYVVVGQVTNANTGAIVSGQVVTLVVDNSLSLTAVTTPNGAYNFSFSYPCNQVFQAVVSLTACGQVYSYTLTITPNTPTTQQNFSICGSPAPCPNYSLTTWLVGSTGIGFTNNNQTATSYSWSMGDGTTYSFPQGNHVYQAPGTYTVCHQAVYSNTCTFDTCFAVTVPAPVSCSVNAVVSPSAAGSQTVQFSYTDSVNPASPPVSVFWDMGNGFQTNNYPNGGTYTYPNPGTYTACVTVAYANGCTATDCGTVTVGQNAGCAYILSGTVVNAQSNAPVVNQVVTVTTSFGSYSAQTNPNGYYIITFMGPCNTAFNASVSVAACGVTNTYLLAVTPNNNTYSMTLTVCGGGNPNPTDSCYVTPQVFTGAGNTIQFTWTGGSALGASVQSVFWDMGNGFVTNNYPNGGSYTFPAPGTYNVCVTVTWSSGCTSTSCTTVTVGQNATQNICGCVTYTLNNPQPINAGCGMAYLVQFNNANTAMIVDSTVITPNGYCFNSVPAGGMYSVFAVPCASLMTSAGVLPTYLGNSIFWQNAIPATANNYQANCISLVNVQNVQGPGLISGTILWGDDKAPGDPVVGVKVYILDMMANPIAMDVTDSEGFYSFAGLPYGTYRIYPEVTGYATYPILVTLSEDEPAFTYANFSLSFEVFTGIEESVVSELTLFPNPASDVVNLSLNSQIAGKAQVMIADMTGKFVAIENINLQSGMLTLTVPVQGLASGFYQVLLVKGNQPLWRTKMIKQ